MRLYAAFAALLALASPTLAVAADSPPAVYVENPAIKQVVCIRKDGRITLGTAFRVGPELFVTAAHVVEATNCEVEGRKAFVTFIDRSQDFALVVNGNRSDHFLKVDCSGIQDGEWFFATGYANGFPRQRVIMLRASGLVSEKIPLETLSGLWGKETVIPGQSGGPMINVAGEATGVVNARHLFFPASYSRSLSDTILCRGAA